jgi:hypothetical protein
MITYVEPTDSREWTVHRNKFERDFSLWCLKNKVSFFNTYQQVQPSEFNKIVKLKIFELIDSFEYLKQLDDTLNINGQKLFYITDNLINTHQSKIFKNIKIISVPELLGIIRTTAIKPINKDPLKLFNCFIQRVDSIRQSWFYFLKHHNLLDKGYVSFLLYQLSFYSDKTGLELFDYNHYTYQLDKIEHFHNAYMSMRDQVPYRNFLPTSDLVSLTKNTKYSLVLETYATEDDHIGYCYTEKLHRALQSPTINLYFSQKNSLTELAKLGFKIDNWLLDIDQLSWVDRQQKLLNILVSDSIDFSPETLYNNAMHNRHLISNYKKQLLNGEYLDKILNEITEA